MTDQSTSHPNSRPASQDLAGEAAFAAYDDNRRGPLILALAVVVLLVFALVVYNAYKRGVRQGDAARLPQIAADGPYKIRPDEPGGLADGDTDKRVFDQIDGTQRDDRIAPRPGREEPIPISAGGGLASKQPNARNIEPPKPLPRAVGEAGEPLDLRPDADTGTPASTQTAELATPTPAPAPRPKPKPAATPKPAPAPAAPSGLDATFSSGGQFVVQLSSLSSAAAADAEWARISGAYSDLFAGAQKNVQVADLGAKGVYHRLRAGSFASRDAAKVFCNSYKARGGDCLVTAK